MTLEKSIGRPTESLYEPLNKEKEEIRLLRVHPSLGRNSSLECTMITTSLQARPPTDFDALSYVWGNPNDTEELNVNGVHVDITVNLAAALRQFQEKLTSPPLLWADAVCINQRDNEERGEQVELMTKIYSDAREVHIWLGPAYPNLSSAVWIMAVVANGESIFELVKTGCCTESDIQALIEYYSHTWWRRVWVVQ